MAIAAMRSIKTAASPLPQFGHRFAASLPQDFRGIFSSLGRPIGTGIAALVGGLYGAEVCLVLAVVIFGWQAMVILTSPAVALRRQPQMVGEAV